VFWTHIQKYEIIFGNSYKGADSEEHVTAQEVNQQGSVKPFLEQITCELFNWPNGKYAERYYNVIF